ncbi:uncharacterized protein LOC126610219 isoform X1 [Malus sylvestris]|uniref:uncharacterized protein LOC126610219 isoform X1 n=1 Tax=Malus sylvestris TaxID=3752 RepID=UPI0021AC4A00|nr:uncharacterized protein LOC126610219 isoform X1 [Malus sylvestris]
MEATSLCPSNYPFYNLGFVNTHRTPYMTRLNPGQAKTPSPVLLHTDETGPFSEFKKGSGSSTALRNTAPRKSFPGLPNTVGIIGGLSVDSSVKFLRKLVNWSSRDGESFPPFVLCSDHVSNKELLSIERSSFPSVSSKSDGPEFNPTPIVEKLLCKRIFLEKSGARCIVMPCHISHSWHDEISKGCSVPFLHIGECVVKELKEAKLKPLEAGSPLRIGVLASHATLTAGFYQEKLQSEGFEVVLPDKVTMEYSVIPAIEALNRKDIEGAQNLLRIALQVLLARVVNSVILASDDMRGLLHLDPLLKKCIDPMDALARSTISWAQSAKKDGSKKKKQKKKKDPNAPKRAMSGFMFFSNMERDNVKRENPGIAFTDVGRVLGEKWRKMSAEEKEPYEAKARQDKERYKDEISGYKNPQSMNIDSQGVQI